MLRLDDADGGFRATLEDGSVVAARTVAVALGMGPHRSAPAELVAMLPSGTWRHTCDAVDFAGARDRRYLLVGGRQSAFEWAALLAEAGARRVDVVHRHDSPAFAAADWTWVTPVVDRLTTDPGWFSRLSPQEQEDLRLRLWAEGRLKVEPWLADRLPAATVRVRPRTSLTGASLEDDGSVRVDLDDGDQVVVDEVLLATGYQPHVDDLQLLRAGDPAAVGPPRRHPGPRRRLPDLGAGVVPDQHAGRRALRAVLRVHHRHPDVRRRHHPRGARPARRLRPAPPPLTKIPEGA